MKKLLLITFLFTSTISFAKTYQISFVGQTLIKMHESCKLKAYRIKGESSNTIGWGHKIKSDDPLWLKTKYVGESITQRQADALFKKDIAEVEKSLNRIMKTLPNATYSQGFVDALGSLIYNCGETGVKRTKFYKRMCNCRVKNNVILKTDYNFAIAAVKTANVSMKGHIKRRQIEYQLMTI